jgi:hypothetical protein
MWLVSWWQERQKERLRKKLADAYRKNRVVKERPVYTLYFNDGDWDKDGRATDEEHLTASEKLKDDTITAFSDKPLELRAKRPEKNVVETLRDEFLEDELKTENRGANGLVKAALKVFPNKEDKDDKEFALKQAKTELVK